jgi:hypothetical protein
MLSTLIAPDLVEYPDSGKVGARSVAGERILLSRPGPILEYWDGEDLNVQDRICSRRSRSRERL